MCETQLRAGLALVDSAGVVLLACRVGAAGCNIRISGYSEVGIAPGLGPGDRAFEPHYSDQNPSEIVDFRGIFLIPPSAPMEKPRKHTVSGVFYCSFCWRSPFISPFRGLERP